MFTNSIPGNVSRCPLTVTFKLSLAKDAGKPQLLKDAAVPPRMI